MWHIPENCVIYHLMLSMRHLGTHHVCLFLFISKADEKNTLMLVRLERKPVERPSLIQWNHSIADVLVHSEPAVPVVLRWVLSTGDVKACVCVCEWKQVEQGGGCKCQSMWTQQWRNVQTQTHRHKMLSNSHSRVNSGTSQSLTSLRDTKYKRRALYWPSVEDRRWKRKMMTNLQKRGKAVCAASLLQEQEWFRKNHDNFKWQIRVVS